jgi:hypothetical protein
MAESHASHASSLRLPTMVQSRTPLAMIEVQQRHHGLVELGSAIAEWCTMEIAWTGLQGVVVFG